MTCREVVGLRQLNLLALGAAMGVPASLIRVRAVSWRGIRIATVPRPDVTMSGTELFLGRITVSGPGQNLSTRAYVFLSIPVEILLISEQSAMCTMSGSKKGLCFASKIRQLLPG
jgi:hypothetical protein